jgi:hypothetical protein
LSEPEILEVITFLPQYSVCKQVLFDSNELAALEVGTGELADLLRVQEVEGRINFVQNIHWGRLELEEGHDE